MRIDQEFKEDMISRNIRLGNLYIKECMRSSTILYKGKYLRKFVIFA